MAILDDANRTPVSPQLLGEAMEMYAGVPGETRLRRLFDLLRDRGFTGARYGDLAIAINFRLTALARLVPSYAANGWTLPGRDGAIPLPADVLVEAAAEQTLVEDVDGVVFDVDDFARRVLQLAEARKAEAA